MEKEELEPHIRQEMDELLSRIWQEGDEQLFHQIYYLIANENVSGEMTPRSPSRRSACTYSVVILLLSAERGVVLYTVREYVRYSCSRTCAIVAKLS